MLAITCAAALPAENATASVLSDVAASMQPGTWAQITVPNQNSVLGVGSVSGSMIHYSNSMPWNPIGKVIEIMGADHNYYQPYGTAVGMRHARYDEATNQFIFLGDQAGIIYHGYDHLSLNPTTGDSYWRMSTAFTGTITAKKKTFGTTAFVDIPSVPAAGSEQIAIGTTWWSGSFVGGGAQGSLMVYNCGNADIYTVGGKATDGQIVAFNPVTGTWFYNQTGRSPFYSNGSSATYHCVIEYSAKKNVAVYGGGNAAPNKLWRMSADGSVVRMPDVPSGKGVGMQQGNFVNDPVTGNFLLLSAGELWELNPDGAGTWTLQTGTRVPPAGVGVPGPTTFQANVDGVISSAIADYGVVAYIKQTSSTVGSFYLYKHGTSTGPSAPSVSITSPQAGTVSGTITVSANAWDATGIAGVQFLVDGAKVSTEATTAPYSITLNSAAYTNSVHTLTAVARNASGIQTASAPVLVTVANTSAVDTVPDAFSFTAQTGVPLTTAVTSNAVVVGGINAQTPISVSGGSYSVNGAAYTTSASSVNNGDSVVARVTSSSSNAAQTCATVTIGGVSGQFCATTVSSGGTGGTTGGASGGLDFATRCAQAGVVKCVGFDNASDFNTGAGGTTGAYGLNSGILPPYGTSDYTRAVRDTSVFASGGGSLKFTIPANAGADTSGSYFTNFSSDLATQFDAGQEFYVQWRQRFSSEYIATKYAGGGGWKQVIVGTGDQPGVIYSSCSALEVPVQNVFHRGFPQMYNSCTGSASHKAYDAFEQPFGTYDFKLQNGRDVPYCLYSQSSTGYFPPNGNCFGYAANEWMTFQMNIKLGPRINGEFQGSYVYLWVAREGKPSELVFQWGPYNLTAGTATEKFGKIYLLPYNTGRDPTVTNPVAYTWYDELIISRSKIADPPYTSSGTATTAPGPFSFASQTSVAPSSVVTSNSVTPTGYTAAAPISVAGGSYSINGGPFVTSAGTINPGQSVAVRQTAASSGGTTTTAAVNIGGVQGTFAVTTAATVIDTTPDNFTFTAQTDVATGTTVTSNTITPTGYNAAAPISVVGGSYSINGGSFVVGAGTISPGQSVAVRQTSSASLGATTSATLTIGGVSGTFSATTQSADTVPNPFSFTAQAGVPASTAVTSNTISVSGINAATPISVSGGTYSVNGASFVGTAGTVGNGNTVAVKLTSSSTAGAQACATLTIGGVSGQFCATTVSTVVDTTPDSYTFLSQTGVAPNTVVTSNTITVTGINAPAGIAITGGTFSVNAGSYTSSTGAVTNGNTVSVRLLTSSSAGTQTCATLNIGGVGGQFCATTATQSTPKVKVGRRGRGHGQIASSAGGIDCGLKCAATATAGSTVTLTATPDAASQFTGWLGGCTGRGSCTFVVNGDTTVSATFAPAPLPAQAFDIDGNGAVDALTDAVIILRYLFDLPVDEMIAGISAGNRAALDPTLIGEYLSDIEPLFDVDGNGQVDALTDGTMILRYLFGLRDSRLIKNAIGPGATRTTPEDVVSYLKSITGVQ